MRIMRAIHPNPPPALSAQQAQARPNPSGPSTRTAYGLRVLDYKNSSAQPSGKASTGLSPAAGSGAAARPLHRVQRRRPRGSFRSERPPPAARPRPPARGRRPSFGPGNTPQFTADSLDIFVYADVSRMEMPLFMFVEYGDTYTFSSEQTIFVVLRSLRTAMSHRAHGQIASLEQV